MHDDVMSAARSVTSLTFEIITPDLKNFYKGLVSARYVSLTSSFIRIIASKY